MDSIDMPNEEKAKIALRLKEIVLLVKKEDGTIKHELYNLEIKEKIASALSDIEYLLNEFKRKEQDEFNITKNNLIENLENSYKIYKKS